MMRVMDLPLDRLNPDVVMNSVQDHLEDLGFPFFLSDLMVFHHLLNNIDTKHNQSLSDLLSIERTVLLRKLKVVGEVDQDEFSRDFSILTRASLGQAVLWDERAKERYRHALTILLTSPIPKEH